MNIRYRVELTGAERCELSALLSAGKHPARKLKRAQILLAADAGINDDDIAETVALDPIEGLFPARTRSGVHPRSSRGPRARRTVLTS